MGIPGHPRADMNALVSEIGGSGHPRVEEKLQYPATHSNYQHHEDWRDTSNIQSNEAFDSPAKDVWMPRDFYYQNRVKFVIDISVLVTCFPLFYGLLKDKKYCLLPWILSNVLSVAMEFSQSLYMLLIKQTEFEPKTAFLFTLSFFIYILHVYAILGVVSQYQLYSSSANSSAAIPGPKLNNDDFYDIEQNQRSIGVQAFESATENNLHPSNSAMPAHDMQLQINNYQTGEHSTTEDRAQKKVKAKIQGRSGFGRRSRRRRNWALGLRNSLKVNRSVGGNGNLEAIEEASVAPPDDESHLHDKGSDELDDGSNANSTTTSAMANSSQKCENPSPTPPNHLDGQRKLKRSHETEILEEFACKTPTFRLPESSSNESTSSDVHKQHEPSENQFDGANDSEEDVEILKKNNNTSDEKEILRSAASSPVVNTALLLNMTTSEHQSNKCQKVTTAV